MLRRFRVELNDGEVAGIAFGAPNAPMKSLFLHANGMNAITYQSILQPLGNFWHVAAVDLRGHGRSRLTTEGVRYLSWNRHRDDVISIIENVAPEGLVLSGHSMGATVALMVAAKRPDLVKGLVLADPVVMSPQFYLSAHIPMLNVLMRSGNSIAKSALKRRRTFASMEEAENGYEGRGAFATWRKPFLHDYLVDGLVPNDENGVTLACSPEWEAAGFRAQRNRPWGAIHKLKKQDFPVIMLQAAKDSTSVSDLDQRVHSVRPDAAVTRVPGTTHFLPMERPYVLRDAIKILIETMDGLHAGTDYVGVVKRTINDSIGQMS